MYVFYFFLWPYGIFDEKHSCLVGENSLNVFHVDFISMLFICFLKTIDPCFS